MTFLEQFHFFYSKISDYTNTNFTLQLACATAGEAIKSILIMALPFLVILFALTVIVFLMQVKWKISFEPMKPKIDRLGPIQWHKAFVFCTETDRAFACYRKNYYHGLCGIQLSD